MKLFDPSFPIDRQPQQLNDERSVRSVASRNYLFSSDSQTKLSFAPPRTADNSIYRRRSEKELLSEVEQLENELLRVREKGKQIAHELDLFRQRRAIFWSDRFRNTFDAWNLMNPGFQQLKDDSSVFNGNLDGYRLQPSISLLRIPYASYKIKLGRPSLCGILLAPVMEIPLTEGEVCLEILDHSQKLLVSSSVSVREVSDEKPTCFTFKPIAESQNSELTLKVYVQGVDAPIRVFELRKYALGGFGKLSTRPFAGYIF